MIEAYLGEDEDDEVVMQEEEQDGEPLEISLHAIFGKDTPETMKIYGRIGQSNFLVLIDSGSNHNFMSLALAQLLRLKPKNEGGMDVMVASREKLRSPGKCVQIPVELQGWKFSIDFYILQLEGYGVVLCIQWLRMLGPI